jgi:DNA-binding NtrC family response regulator
MQERGVSARCSILRKSTTREIWALRFLRNAVEQIVAFGIEEVSLDEAPERPAAIDVPFKIAKARLVEGFERDYLVSVLAQHKGNITAAANAAELDRVHFLRLLDRYGLRKPR